MTFAISAPSGTREPRLGPRRGDGLQPRRDGSSTSATGSSGRLGDGLGPRLEPRQQA